MTIHFLLIHEFTDNFWVEFLEETLAPLGKLHRTDVRNSTIRIVKEEYDVVVIDAASVKEVEYLVSRLRAKKKNCRIVVITSSPTWQRARAAFEAGAMDYFSRSFDKTELLDTFRRILREPLPKWPR